MKGGKEGGNVDYPVFFISILFIDFHSNLGLGLGLGLGLFTILYYIPFVVFCTVRLVGSLVLC
jgi:hypothetical protein